MSDEGIGRTANVGRFAALHAAADTVVDALEQQYWAVRAEGLHVDPALAGRRSIRIVRLTPVNLDGAPVTVEYTDFPGLSLRFGRCYTTSLPVCGCDYCDDDPDTLIDDLKFMIAAVLSGGFQESGSDTQIYGSFDTPMRSSSSGSVLPLSRAATDIQQPEGKPWGLWVPRTDTRPTATDA